MQRRIFLAGGLGASALALMGHTPYPRWYRYRARHAVIATDRTDARSLPLGARLARHVAARRPDLGATAARSESPRALLSLLRSHQLDLVLLRAEDAYRGLHGAGPYASLQTPLRALAAVAPEYLYVVVAYGSPVRAMRDLKGARVGLVDDGGRVRVKARRVAAALGLEPESDVVWVVLDRDDAPAAIADGRVGAACLEGPRPGPLAAETPPTGGRLRLVPHGAAVPALVARHGPIYFRSDAPGDGVGEPRLLACRDDYPAPKAQALAEALAGWEELAPPGTPLPIPRHPALAAIREAPA